MNTSGRNRVVRVRSFAICQSHKAPLSLPTLLCATLSEGATGCRKQTCDGPSFTWTADRSILELTRSFVRFGLLWARLGKITRFSIALVGNAVAIILKKHRHSSSPISMRTHIFASRFARAIPTNCPPLERAGRGVGVRPGGAQVQQAGTQLQLFVRCIQPQERH